MSFLSNSEIRQLAGEGQYLVEGLDRSAYSDRTLDGPIEAASVKLKVGSIFQYSEMDESSGESRKYSSIDLEQGEMAFVATLEKVNLPKDIGGLMFPKSGGIAEKGILITNTGHVDPGFHGNLRYAVVNMGNARFHLRQGDFLVKVMFFRMYKSSSPDWGEMHSPLGEPDLEQVRYLGKSLAAINTRVEERATVAARDEFRKLGLHALLWSFAVAGVTSIFATVITIMWGFLPMIERLVAN